MTHYLISSVMPPENLEYMLFELKRRKFKWDTDYCNKVDLCSCLNESNACIREIRLFEIDVPSPADKHFQEFLQEFGFADLQSRVNLNYFISKLYYKIMTKVMQMIARFNRDYRKLKNYNGTRYSDFEPMPNTFNPKGTTGFNCRNIILGRVREVPIGSFDNIPCPKCGRKVNRH